MKTADGIKVIEFNARFGDPETEVVLPLLKSDIYDVFDAVASGREAGPLKWKKAVTLRVVLASKGYPGKYEKGCPVELGDMSGVSVYHMGTAIKDGRLVTAGGRVMMVVAEGVDLHVARDKAYEAVARVSCANLFHRDDIGHCAFETGVARVIDGNAISAAVKDRVKARVPELEAEYGRKPCLAVIIVGENPPARSTFATRSRQRPTPAWTPASSSLTPRYPSRSSSKGSRSSTPTTPSTASSCSCRSPGISMSPRSYTR